MFLFRSSTEGECKQPLHDLIEIKASDHGHRHSAGNPSRGKGESARVLGYATGHSSYEGNSEGGSNAKVHDGYSDRGHFVVQHGCCRAVSPGRMISSIQSGNCPENASPVAIYSKDPFCTFYHLSGDQCQHNWKEYWRLTAQYNEFLEQCRMQKKVGHLQ